VLREERAGRWRLDVESKNRRSEERGVRRRITPPTDQIVKTSTEQERLHPISHSDAEIIWQESIAGLPARILTVKDRQLQVEIPQLCRLVGNTD